MAQVFAYLAPIYKVPNCNANYRITFVLAICLAAILNACKCVNYNEAEKVLGWLAAVQAAAGHLLYSHDVRSAHPAPMPPQPRDAPTKQ